MATTPEQSAGVLKEAKRLLDELEIPFCLFLGTALGAYRDKKFCDGDEDDIDLAISDKYYDRVEDIKEKFKDFENEHHWCSDDKKCPEISFTKRWAGTSYTKIDIFFISEINNKSAWKFYPHSDPNAATTKLIDKRFFEKFDQVEFYGETFNIPCCVEDYLEANYGDWKTPINRKFFSWQSGNQAEIL